MRSDRKKLILTIVDIVVMLIADFWVLWLCVYFAQTIDGAIFISNKNLIFERNYLVPAQIFGITVIATVGTWIIYYELRKKSVIGKRYIMLALFNTLPLWLMSIDQVRSMAYYWDWIY